MIATHATVSLGLGSWLGGLVEADPWIAAVLIGAIVAAAVAFVVMRVQGRK